MKKSFVLSMIAVILASATLPSIGGMIAYADDMRSLESVAPVAVTQYKPTSVINVVEPYVEVTNDGKIELQNVPTSVYEEYQLDQLQEHFNRLNAEVDAGNIRINNDLSIATIGISPRTVHGTWTYHWWGYDQYFDNQRAQRFSANCYSVAAGATLVTGIGAWFPPVSFVGVAQAAYWTLVGSRVDYNNLGNGVYIGVTWAAIFNVEPL